MAVKQGHFGYNIVDRRNHWGAVEPHSKRQSIIKSKRKDGMDNGNIPYYTAGLFSCRKAFGRGHLKTTFGALTEADS